MHFFHEIAHGKGRGLTPLFFCGVGIPACWIASSSGCIVWACLSFDPEVHYLQIVCVGFATSFDATMFRFFLVCCLFPMHFFWFHSLPMIFGRWFCPRHVFRCRYLQIFRASFVWRTCFDATIFGCVGIIVVPLRFLETSIFGFCGLFFQGIFANAVIFCFLPLILPMPFFMSLSSVFLC